MGPRASTLGRWVAGALAVFLLSLCACFGASLAAPASFAGLALADPPPTYMSPADDATEPGLTGLGSCPSGGLSAYGGTDDAAAELRDLRNELAAACTAVTDRQDELAHRLWWVTGELLHLHDQGVTSNSQLDAIKTAVTGTLQTSLPGIDSSSPLAVHETQQAAAAAPIADSVDASGTALKEAIWFLAGALIACLVGYAIYRQVMPRA